MFLITVVNLKTFLNNNCQNQDVKDIAQNDVLMIAIETVKINNYLYRLLLNLVCFLIFFKKKMFLNVSCLNKEVFNSNYQNKQFLYGYCQKQCFIMITLKIKKFLNESCQNKDTLR